MRIDESNAQYKLQSFISHKGTNTGCGHYVSHSFNEERCILFNDEKVVLVTDVDEALENGYVYFYVKDVNE